MWYLFFLSSLLTEKKENYKCIIWRLDKNIFYIHAIGSCEILEKVSPTYMIGTVNHSHISNNKMK